MNTEQLFKDFNFNPDNLRGMLSNINDTINKNIIINYDEIPEEKKPGYMKLYKSPYISLPTLDINIENQPCGDGLKKKILKDIHDEKKN